MPRRRKKEAEITSDDITANKVCGKHKIIHTCKNVLKNH